MSANIVGISHDPRTDIPDGDWSAPPVSRETERLHLKALASEYGAKCRVNGVGSEVTNAWAAFAAAVDELLGDK